MKKILTIVASALMLCSCCGGQKEDIHLPKADSYRTRDAGVEKFLQHIRGIQGTGELNSVMILKDGKKVVEYYDACYGPDFLNICWSASKTFTATAIGFAVQDGLLTVQDKLVSFLKPEQLPATVSDTLAGLTVYDLLRMASGLKSDPIGPTGSLELKTPTKTVLEQGFIFAPGEYYKYNSHNTYLLSVIVTNLTGKTVEDYLAEKLFAPLGIRNWHWDTSAEGCSMGGWGLYITTESLAKMGQFFLQKGVWEGKRLLNEEWFEQAMSPQILQYKNRGLSEEEIAALSPEWNQGYGYQMWCCTHGAARLDGAHGQWSIILPNENAVIVVTGNCSNTRKEFDGIWEYLYPEVK